jgi:hypothetical protein
MMDVMTVGASGSAGAGGAGGSGDGMNGAVATPAPRQSRARRPRDRLLRLRGGRSAWPTPAAARFLRGRPRWWWRRTCRWAFRAMQVYLVILEKVGTQGRFVAMGGGTRARERMLNVPVVLLPLNHVLPGCGRRPFRRSAGAHADHQRERRGRRGRRR